MNTIIGIGINTSANTSRNKTQHSNTSALLVGRNTATTKRMQQERSDHPLMFHRNSSHDLAAAVKQHPSNSTHRASG
jgi:hypothetical protein